jgi:Tfp pilus assembly protein FimV
VAVREELLGEPVAAGGRKAQIYAFPIPARPSSAARRRMLARRRKAVQVATLLVAAAAVLSIYVPGPVAPARSPAPVPGSVVVRPGDTLWSVAGRFASSEADLRAYVDAMAALNHTHGQLLPGQRLRLPSPP